MSEEKPSNEEVSEPETIDTKNESKQSRPVTVRGHNRMMDSFFPALKQLNKLGQLDKINLTEDEINQLSSGDSTSVQDQLTKQIESNDRGFGTLLPRAIDRIKPSELLAASFTPLGANLCYIAPAIALQNGWRYVSQKGKKDPITFELKERLAKLCAHYRLYHIAKSAISTARIYGRCLVFREEVEDKRRKTKYKLFVTPINNWEITYSEDGLRIEKYRPFVRRGLGKAVPVEVQPDQGVLFINGIDPQGNGFEGLSALLPAYNSILWALTIENAWAKVISTRGLGLIHMVINGAGTEEELDPWIEEYGDPSTYDAVFSNDSVKVNSIPGIAASFSLKETLSQFTTDIAAATGFSQMQIEGNHPGSITGSTSDYNKSFQSFREILETFEPYLIDLHYLVDPDLDQVTEEWELDFEFDQKLDRETVARIFATNVQSISLLPELITVNQALEKMELPTIDSPDGDLPVREYMIDQFPEVQENPQGQPQTNKEDGVGLNKEQESERKAEQREQNDSFAVEKLMFARRLLVTRQSENSTLYKFSLDSVNSQLKEVFNEGYSITKLIQIRKGEI